MSDDTGTGERPQMTVGSLLGLPLGATGDAALPGTEAAAPGAPVQAAGSIEDAAGGLTTEERAWTVAAGRLGGPSAGLPFGADGVEAMTYNNVLRQDIEQVWFDGKLVYALDLGEVDVDPSRVKVAQEYQIVYAAELDEQGKPTSEPARVPGQLNIYDSAPGMEQYSPIWQFNYVVVPGDYAPNTLRSERECVASGYRILRSQVFEN
jgi:hypothetical protein